MVARERDNFHDRHGAKESLEGERFEDRVDVAANLTAITTLIERLEPRVNGADRDWELYLKPDGRWVKLDAKLYNDTWYFSLLEPVNRGAGTSKQFLFSFSPNSSEDQSSALTPEVVERLAGVRGEIARTVERVGEDPLRYHGELQRSIPPTLRYGVLPRSFVRDLLPEWQSFHKELSSREIGRMIELCERSDGEPLEFMTAGRFFDYCRVAYGANPKSFERYTEPFDTNASGVELYSRYADGRDDGLRKITPDSPAAFHTWYRSARLGGHPWEIYRGGNSTHIDLAVLKESERGEGSTWRVLLSAFSTSRLVETCRIALAFEDAGLPFTLEHRESYLRRLRGTDMVGLVPDEMDLRYGHHHFPKEFGVADSIRFQWFRDEETGKQLRPWREIIAAATWLPIPELRLAPPKS